MSTEPTCVRLTADYLDLHCGIAYRKGTVLHRQQTGQYAVAGTKLGQECVAFYRLIADISEPLRSIIDAGANDS